MGIWERFHMGDIVGAETQARSIVVAGGDDVARAKCILGVLAWRRGSVDLGLSLARKAVEIDPNDVEILRVAGRQHMEAAQFDSAIDYYRRAHDVLRTPQSHIDLALALLSASRWQEGWAEQECRVPIELRKSGIMRNRPRNLWNGDDMAGPLLIHGEAGFGDMIQFARYLAAVLERCPRVTFKVPRQLGRLMAQSFPGVDIDAGPWTHHTPSRALAFEMSLPHLLKQFEPDNTAGYLRADPVALGHSSRPRVGLVWGGNPTQPRDPLRSLPKHHLNALLSCDAVEWHILQQGPHLNELVGLSAASRAIDHPEIQDFADTASLIQSLDLVVTVCTSVAHLAGALGKKTILMLSTVPDFRWPLPAEDGRQHAWYRSIEIIRQTLPGQWADVVDRTIERVKQCLT
jgi:hypothetical protein